MTAGAAETVLNTFDQHPEVDLIYGEVEWMDAAGKQTGEHRGDIASLEQLLDIYTVWFGARQWVQPEVFFRRSLWEKAGPFNTKYDLAFDYAFWVQCMMAGAQVMKVGRPLARFRIHDQQKSANATKAAAEMRDIVQGALEQNPPISSGGRARINAQLNYDMYQLAPQPKAAFATVLMRNPSWLRSPAVRQRLWRSVFRS
jgi:hypothetical protein